MIEEKEFLNTIITVSNKLDWNVSVCGETITFSKFSPAGQDFNTTVTADSLEKVVQELNKTCDDFDCSYETYLWLDNEGHGINGAPYNMKHLYEDMEACLENIEELRDELNKIL